MVQRIGLALWSAMICDVVPSRPVRRDTAASGSSLSEHELLVSGTSLDGYFVLDDFIKIAVPPGDVDVVIGWIFGFGDDVYGLNGQEMKVGTGGGFNEQVIW